MHNVTLPEDLRRRIAEHRGCAHVFATIVPEKTAHLIVDMQNHFVAPDGLSRVDKAAGIVGNINRLAAAVRARGGLNVWIRVTLAQDGFGAWQSYTERFVPPEKRAEVRAALMPGSKGHAFWPELDIRDADLISDKSRFSAFIQGASDIEAELGGRGIDTLLVTGTLTNVCCESTARDAAMRDFRVIMVEDACAARTDEDHLAGLRTVAQVFGDVRPTDEVIALLES